MSVVYDSAAQPLVINLYGEDSRDVAMNRVQPNCWAILLCCERVCIRLLSPEIPLRVQAVCMSIPIHLSGLMYMDADI